MRVVDSNRLVKFVDIESPLSDSDVGSFEDALSYLEGDM